MAREEKDTSQVEERVSGPMRLAQGAVEQEILFEQRASAGVVALRGQNLGQVFARVCYPSLIFQLAVDHQRFL